MTSNRPKVFILLKMRLSHKPWDIVHQRRSSVIPAACPLHISLPCVVSFWSFFSFLVWDQALATQLDVCVADNTHTQAFTECNRLICYTLLICLRKWLHSRKLLSSFFLFVFYIWSLETLFTSPSYCALLNHVWRGFITLYYLVSCLLPLIYILSWM